MSAGAPSRAFHRGIRGSPAESAGYVPEAPPQDEWLVALVGQLVVAYDGRRVRVGLVCGQRGNGSR